MNINQAGDEVDSERMFNNALKHDFISKEVFVRKGSIEKLKLKLLK